MDKFLELPCIEFSIGELSSYGKIEQFCTIKFFKNNEKIYRFFMLAIRKVFVCGKSESNFWCVNLGNQKCLTSFEFKDMISKKMYFLKRKPFKMMKVLLVLCQYLISFQRYSNFDYIFCPSFILCYQLLNVLNQF